MDFKELRAISANARGILGEFNHGIEFPQEDSLQIIYGPNGVGKTTFLEIIHAIFQFDGRSLRRLYFESANIEFFNGWQLIVTRITHDLSEDDSQSDNEGKDTETKVTFTLEGLSDERTPFSEEWIFEGPPIEDILMHESRWRRVGPDYWEDRETGEILLTAEVEASYQPVSERRKKLPPYMAVVKELAPSKLIETQRLRADLFRQTTRTRVGFGRKLRDQTRIQQLAQVVGRSIGAAQTKHSVIAQKLDRTFPTRMLDPQVADMLDASDIRKRFEEQEGFRSKIAQVVDLKLEDGLKLREQDLDDFMLKVLSIYQSDTDAKLAPFRELMQKVELLEKLLNGRLLNKSIQVNSEDGVRVSDTRNERRIELNSLSSGEQHEIILFLDLLFAVEPGALVLIDEPEISLHVGWQLSFIRDVLEIAQIVGFRFIVATHSPQIINEFWSHAHRLGPEEEDF